MTWAVTGAELRHQRRRLGQTQAALAAKLSVATNTVARWVRGDRAIREPIARLVLLLSAHATPERRKQS